MSKNESLSVHSANVQEPTGEQRRLNRGAYQAPRLVVVGSAVELVQGMFTGRYYDGNRGCYGR
jgi:hypothetical protein